MKRTVVFTAFLAVLVLSIPAKSQGGDELERQLTDLAGKVVALEKTVKAQQVVIKQLMAWTKTQDGRNADLGAKVLEAIKKGYYFPAPANDAKKALLEGLMGLSGSKAKMPDTHKGAPDGVPPSNDPRQIPGVPQGPKK